MITFIAVIVVGVSIGLLILEVSERRKGLNSNGNCVPMPPPTRRVRRGSNPPPPGGKPVPPLGPPPPGIYVPHAAPPPLVPPPDLLFNDGPVTRGIGHGGPSTPKPPIDPNGHKSMNFPDPAHHISFQNCARCGATHITLSCFKFSRPCGRFTHWAQCPSTLEPIMVRFVEDDEEGRE